MDAIEKCMEKGWDREKAIIWVKYGEAQAALESATKAANKLGLDDYDFRSPKRWDKRIYELEQELKRLKADRRAVQKVNTAQESYDEAKEALDAMLEVTYK